MKERAARNRTLTLSDEDIRRYRNMILPEDSLLPDTDVVDRILHGDATRILPRIPAASADLLFLDPPYNLTKDFHGNRFTRSGNKDYLEYLRSWFPSVLRVLKPDGSVYLCGDWRSASAIQTLMEEHLVLRNRITWQRDKGRGARHNWKNMSEDIWFGTAGPNYYFDVESVKMKRRVIAPYRNGENPRGWDEEPDGKYRLTCPGNLWDDITVPYWSMPENTEHPTQKPEKLLAKILLASCPPGGTVLDPFLGSGTTAVTARKLGRRFVGIETVEEYCLWAAKRLDIIPDRPSIQGYQDGVFWERNSKPR